MQPSDIINPEVNDYDFDDVDPDERLQENRVQTQQEAPGDDVSDEMLRNDVSNPNSWLYYNKGPEERGYSPASRITTDNVSSLSREYLIEDYDGFQNQPIIVPSDPPVLYYTRAIPQQVVAVNARTGDQYWSFSYSNEDLKGLTASNRGLAIRGDKVYLGSHDNHVVAIDRYTGEMQWKTRTLTPRQKDEMQTPERMANTQAPVAYDGMVYKGMTGYYGGFGAFFGLDAESGEIVWHQTVVPEDEWVDETWRYGDASPWNNAAIDPETETIFIPGANPGPMLNGVVRPGPNKHSESVIAADIKSGEIKWTTQLVPHDWHDYDTYNTRVIELEVDGERQRVVEAVNKTGWLYFLDIETGNLIERTKPYAKQGGEVSFMGILPKGRENRAAVWPSDWGATEWTPDAYSPQTGLVYVAANDTVKRYWYDDYDYNEDEAVINVGGGWTRGSFDEFPDIQRSTLAIDPGTGEVVWEHNYEPVESRARTGGTTVTGGNVAFGSAPEGTLFALDAETGEALWNDHVSDQNRGITAAPVTWDDPNVNKQYVAIASLDGIAVYGLEG